jgi:hypothetical protein
MPDRTHVKSVQPSLADLVAALVLGTYIALPNNGKPAVRSNGVSEWTVLAAVVCEHQGRVTHVASL